MTEESDPGDPLASEEVVAAVKDLKERLEVWHDGYKTGWNAAVKAVKEAEKKMEPY